MRYRPSLYLRLILTLLGPLLIAMAAAWAIGVGIVTNALEQRLEGQLRNAATVLATSGIPYTPEVLRRLAAVQQSDFVLVDHAGRVVVTTSGRVGDAIAASLAERRTWSNSETRKLEAPVQSIAVYQSIDASEEPRYSALVAVAPLGDAAAAARSAARWLGLAMLAATAVLGAVLLALVRNITRPLAQLSAFADRIAAGEREHRLELPRADEIGALGESLNTMMLRLGDYESRLASRSRMSALGEMSARLAHEIRNPLTGLKLHLQLLAERVDGRESDRVERLLTEVQRLELLVSSTLLLGGEQPLDLALTRVRPLIAEVLDLMGPSLAHVGIRVDSRCDEGLQARVDRGRVRQALLNLIVNAADAMPQGGALRISAELDAAASRVLILVEDSGPGLAEDVRVLLGDAAVSTKPFGLGLGMTVCREVAAAHGGELRIERSSDLGGACFVLAFPLSLAPSAPDMDD
ncbi:MAG: HAMP domain-containing sensor histidine kinase [Betaproteobacteria bacterium]